MLGSNCEGSWKPAKGFILYSLSFRGWKAVSGRRNFNSDIIEITPEIWNYNACSNVEAFPCLKGKENRASLREVENKCEFSVSRLWEADNTTCRPRHMGKGAELGEMESSGPPWWISSTSRKHIPPEARRYRGIYFNSVFPYHFITLEDFWHLSSPLAFFFFFHYSFRLGYSKCGQTISSRSWLDNLQSHLRTANLESVFQQIPS